MSETKTIADHDAEAVEDFDGVVQDIRNVQTLKMAPGGVGGVKIARHESVDDMAAVIDWIASGVPLTLGGARLAARMYHASNRPLPQAVKDGLQGKTWKRQPDPKTSLLPVCDPKKTQQIREAWNDMWGTEYELNAIQLMAAHCEAYVDAAGNREIRQAVLASAREWKSVMRREGFEAAAYDKKHNGKHDPKSWFFGAMLPDSMGPAELTVKIPRSVNKRVAGGKKAQAKKKAKVEYPSSSESSESEEDSSDESVSPPPKLKVATGFRTPERGFTGTFLGSGTAPSNTAPAAGSATLAGPTHSSTSGVAQGGAVTPHTPTAGLGNADGGQDADDTAGGGLRGAARALMGYFTG